MNFEKITLVRFEPKWPFDYGQESGFYLHHDSN